MKNTENTTPPQTAGAPGSENLRAMVRIQRGNCIARVADPKGAYPKCKPVLGTTRCFSCGRDVRTGKGACPTVPAHERWSMKRQNSASECRCFKHYCRKCGKEFFVDAKRGADKTPFPRCCGKITAFLGYVDAIPSQNKN